MINEISITVRLPSELNSRLQEASKKLGMTKTNLIRCVIHELLNNDDYTLIFHEYSGKRDRLLLNVNQNLHDILTKTCCKYSQSMNAVITAVSYAALEYSAKLLK